MVKGKSQKSVDCRLKLVVNIQYCLDTRLTMLIALTHEQADFDALASLLGVHLLDESVLPILPRKSNRNVRAFLTIYGDDLPFLDPRDLTGEPVEAVTLVDTQSVVSVKGMSEATRMRVIDHHPLRDDLPLDWDITVSGTGANTTLFVENIQERDIPLNTIQATLLLMGIYEDTGSLTYYQTKPRDLRAASYLLEQGASLQIAADFLNHPLSEGQQVLYDRLRASAEITQRARFYGCYCYGRSAGVGGGDLYGGA